MRSKTLEDNAAHPPRSKTRYAAKVIVSLVILPGGTALLAQFFKSGPDAGRALLAGCYLILLAATIALALYMKKFRRDAWMTDRIFFFIAWASVPIGLPIFIVLDMICALLHWGGPPD